MSSQQIERYSRQIIVPGIGGIGQERLLASHLLIAGDRRDVEPALQYMVGAGVGKIALQLSDSVPAWLDSLVARMRSLNSDVSITSGEIAPNDVTLALGLIGSAAALEVVRRLCRERPRLPMVLARLDSSPRIAILPAPPPCATCADPNLLGESSECDEDSGVVAMAAAVEALALLSRAQPLDRATLIEFTGYATTSREIHRRADAPACACAGGHV